MYNKAIEFFMDLKKNIKNLNNIEMDKNFTKATEILYYLCRIYE